MDRPAVNWVRAIAIRWGYDPDNLTDGQKWEIDIFIRDCADLL